MNLPDIMPTLQTIVQGLPALSALQDHVHLDDGLQETPMEKDLKKDGLTILIMAPMGFQADGESKGNTWIDYSATIRIRTDPHVLGDDGKAAWDPLVLEAAIISAAMQFSRPLKGQYGFRISAHAEPETDFMDTGCYSRLVRLMTRVTFQ